MRVWIRECVIICVSLVIKQKSHDSVFPAFLSSFPALFSISSCCFHLDGCPNLCNGNGQCTMGQQSWHCECQTGWRGPGCSVAMETSCADNKDNEGGDLKGAGGNIWGGADLITPTLEKLHVEKWLQKGINDDREKIMADNSQDSSRGKLELSNTDYQNIKCRIEKVSSFLNSSVLLFLFLSDGLTDCMDPDCCIQTPCQNSPLCRGSRDPLQVIQQSPMSQPRVRSFYDRVKMLVGRDGTHIIPGENPFNSRYDEKTKTKKTSKWKKSFFLWESDNKQNRLDTCKSVFKFEASGFYLILF